MSTVSRETILKTEPLSKYENVVENILRDKEAHWSYDYYKDTSTSYDSQVAKAHAEVNREKFYIKKYESGLSKITEALEASKKQSNEPGFKKLTVKETEALEAEYSEIYKLKCEHMVKLDGATRIRQGYEWKQYLQRKRLGLLQSLRNTFMLDGDADYMTRAVTWVEEHIERMRISI